MTSILPLIILASFGQTVSTQATASENIIPNGDFSQGNTGFKSDLPYNKPAVDCLWPGAYTIAARFNQPQLHHLIAPEALTPPKHGVNDKVLFANAGGTEALTIWQTDVKCKPNTRYTLSFMCMSMTGYMTDGNPPRQVATEEWAPEFEIWANDEPSTPIRAGLLKYYKGSMVWDSGKKTKATIKIVRTKFPHGGGLIAIGDIRMIAVPVEKTAGN